MQIGIIGLGRMGANIARRLMRAGHSCVVYDVKADAVADLAEEGAIGVASLTGMVSGLTPPRAIWMMLPAAIVDDTIADLVEKLQPGDTLIDGGNSYYRDDIARGNGLSLQGIHYVDVGTSGGVWGLERGYCQMIGGDAEVVRRLDPIFAALAPSMESAPRTPARAEHPETTAEHGYLHCGPHGAGHFVKMVHNGIEYGVMAALAEGFNILHGADIGLQSKSADAETAPVRNAATYRYTFDVAEIAEVWRRGSVIASWLLDLSAEALFDDSELSEFHGRVSDSGEGRWTVKAAIDEGIPAPVLSVALFERFTSRGNGDFADKLLSAMRHQFGGHTEKQPAKKPAGS